MHRDSAPRKGGTVAMRFLFLHKSNNGINEYNDDQFRRLVEEGRRPVRVCQGVFYTGRAEFQQHLEDVTPLHMWASRSNVEPRRLYPCLSQR